MPRPKKSSSVAGIASSPPRPSATDIRKANEAVGLRIKSGRFTFVSRKLLNIFIFVAQKAGMPGLNAPPGEPGAEGYFWVRMADIISGFNYSSGNTELIKQTAHEMQSVKVVQTTTKSWTDEVMLSGVKVWNSHGVGNRNGEVWLGFAFSPTFQDLVLKPDNNFTKYSLYYQGILSGAQALALYEVCRRYATSPSRVTFKQTYEFWFHVLTGNPIESGEPTPEYKYFKRDVVKPAIAEINANTDIEIELVEFKLGRRVESLQFKVSLKPQAALEFMPEIEPGPLLDMKIVEQIMRLGITQEDATEIFAQYGEQSVLAHIALVEKRQNGKSGTTLASPAAYFKVAIANGYATNPHVAEPAVGLQQETPSEPQKDLKAQYIAARNKQALEYFSELEATEQSEMLARFVEQADKTIHAYYKKKGLEMKTVRSAFGEWLAMEVWGAVTETDMIAFHDKGSVIQWRSR
jgi:hypothetical protein